MGLALKAIETTYPSTCHEGQQPAHRAVRPW